MSTTRPQLYVGGADGKMQPWPPPPAKPSRSTPGPLARWLLARGWTRSDAPADQVPECGIPSELGESGWCAHTARWQHPRHDAMCAQHARIAERNRRHGWQTDRETR